jgi:aminoglycoside/choline kinase family phosphotransferase
MAPGRRGSPGRVRSADFWDRSGWTGATRQPLAGDASSRAYERITAGGATAILMNAPARAAGPAIYGGRSYDDLAHRALDVGPFIAIDLALREAGLRAPEIRAADPEAGLLILEDLGGDGVLDASGLPILERYEAAVDVLVSMHGRLWPEQVDIPGAGTYRVPPYDRDALLVEISLFPDWFGGHGGEPAFPKESREGFLRAWSEVLDTIDATARTWVMRDFHSPNILWQRGAEGLHRVGIIDFQDTLIGHPAYDLASLAQDARAPLTEDDEAQLKARYVAGRRSQDPDFDAAIFETAYVVLAAQRATKVLGAFTRLAVVEGKPGYQRHRERLKGLLRRNLAHPVLSGLQLWYEPYI